ncbi:MAG: hypothetical protein WDM77_17920 [Steroidobacteraceae bacterium]
MSGYYLKLALGSLRRNIVITALMVAAVGVGIGRLDDRLHSPAGHVGQPDSRKIRPAVRTAD